ncbi:hypothetical protein CB0940_06223 [Cercospora beticola]|uniref:N-acetyltransferase domain-containing protein n=1 Tax=Cercospora beticola TaxID=122368 RepID=A0A2G5HYX1_CERBT|nr:hypothetical protein CB0940_06223 [Cercospora beticola]PIA97745.1 hypothetical protein CB0940_06223 [Cercospora beticola]
MQSSFASANAHRRTSSNPSFKIRPERPKDHEAIRQVISAAFAKKSHLQHREFEVVEKLRNAGQLSVSLVATTGVGSSQQGEDIDEDEFLVGYVAVSPVSIVSHGTEIGYGEKDEVGNMGGQGWYGLGPVAVRPELQGQGIGPALIWKARDVLIELGASGWVVCGRRELYAKFGFDKFDGLWVDGVPKSRFFCAALKGDADRDHRRREVRYCDAWNIL